MPRFDVTWTWTAESPLHLGSGLSRPGVADRMVVRGLDGGAATDGDVVKGALHKSAFEVLRWLKVVVGDGSGEARCGPQAWIFGGHERTHIAGNLGADAKLRRVRSTAIGPTGSAKEETFRVVEVIERGATIRAGVTIDFPTGTPDTERDSAITLLLAAIAGTEVVGGDGGTGWGRVTLSKLTARLANAGVDPAEALGTARLERLRDAAKAASTDVAALILAENAHATKSPAAQPLVWRRLHITLEPHEAATFSSAHEVSNEIRTEQFPRATTLRGAFREAWRRDGCSSADIDRWLGEETRWTPAYPTACDGSGADDEVWAASIPTPRSLEAPLGTDPLVRNDVIFDSLARATRPESDWGRVPEPFVVPALRGSVASLSEPTSITGIDNRMHIARDYTTGGKRMSALFSRQVVGSGSQFIAWVRTHGDATIPTHVRLGKRRSTSGSAGVVAYGSEGPLADAAWCTQPSQTAAQSPDIYLQLLGPAIVRDPHGAPRRSLEPAHWLAAARAVAADGSLDAVVVAPLGTEREAGAQSYSVSRCRSGFEQRRGWMAPWGHLRASTTAIAAGSVWRLHCPDPNHASALRKALRSLADSTGIGERTHEGYGWFVVDPPWLGVFTGVGATAARSQFPALDDAPQPPEPSQSCPPLPGYEGVDAHHLAAIYAAVCRLTEETVRDAQSPARQLANRLRGRRGEDLADATTKAFKWAKNQAGGSDDVDRERARNARWKALAKASDGASILKLLSEHQRYPRRFMFVLEAVMIRAAMLGVTDA